ncbi:MAG TPA: VOC family protein [Candidatus Eisenbacteria bacterium]
MTSEMPTMPAGSGQHPVTLVVISANRLDESTGFYSSLFGWKMQPLSGELTAIITPDGPAAALRTRVPAGFPGIVPYLRVSDVEAAMARVVAAGATVERAPWNVAPVGTLARFKDASGTIYGVTNGMAGRPTPAIPVPFGDNPKPLPGSICSLEMYAADGAAAAAFFGEQFGWGSAAMMPQYMSFNPGAGISGVFQSHTPALPAVAYIYVSDVHATIAAIEAAGGKRVGDPMAMPGMATFGYFTDASGTSMGLIGP